MHLKSICLLTSLCGLALLSSCVSHEKAAATPLTRGGVILNEDSSNYYMFRNDDEVISGLSELARHYCVGGITDVFYTCCARQASFDSKVLEPVWKDVEFREDGKVFFRKQELTAPTLINWAKHTKMLADAGINPYQVWVDESRKLGRKGWISIRTNDLHGVNEIDGFMNSDFWRQHPEYWRITWRGGNWGDRAFDFKHPEVQQELINFVAELLEINDMDGLEIDWMRFGWQFQPGYEDEGREILTNIHREIRRLARQAEKRLGHPIAIAARVPSRPEYAFVNGYDPIRWAKEGLIDMLIPCNFWATTDPQLPVALWRSMLPENVLLAPGIETLVAPYSGAPLVGGLIDVTVGQACSFFYQGADKFYLFNHMDRPGNGAETVKYLAEHCASLEAAAASKRRHVIAYSDIVPPGLAGNAVLPLRVKGIGALRFNIGLAPEADRNAVVLLGLDEEPGEGIVVFVNGKRAEPLTDNIPQDGMNGSVKARRAWKASNLLKNGDNHVEIQYWSDTPKLNIVWAEINIAAKE